MTKEHYGMVKEKRLLIAVVVVLSVLLLSCPVIATEITYTMPTGGYAGGSAIFGIYYMKYEYANLTYSIKAEFDGATNERSICNFSTVPMYDSFDVDITEGALDIGDGHITYTRTGALYGCGAGEILLTISNIDTNPIYGGGLTGVHAVSFSLPAGKVLPYAYATSEYAGDYNSFFGVVYSATGYPTGSDVKYTINYGVAPAPVCSFTAVPTSGASPLLVTFTDTSTGSPTSWDWLIKNNGTGFTEQISSSLQSFSATLNNPTTFDVNFTATNAYGNCNLFAPNYITTTTPATTTLTLSVVDAISHNVISGASVGLQNITSLAWTNTTAPTGSYTFINSDGTSALPLSVGQTVTLAASAYGYNSGVSTITIPYSGYSTSIALMPTTAVNATGTFWLTVYVSKNEDGLPLQAIVQVLSGGQSYQSGTAPNGYTTFQNITSSTTFSVTAFAQAYQAQTKVLPVTADFMNVSFSLVRIGATPVTTPATPAVTATPMPTFTNAAGQPISESEGSVLDAFAQLSRALGGFFSIGIGIIMIWLMWVLVYELTGGKVLDKLMRRGRR